jgi:hypothetical protein
MDDRIKEAISNNNYAAFKEYCVDVPEWKDILEILHKSYHYFKNTNIADPKMASGSIMIRNRLDPVICKSLMFSDIKFNDHPSSPFISTKNIVHDIMGRDFTTSVMLLNLVGNEDDYETSIYDYNILIWHCAGDAEFRLYNKKEDSAGYESFESSEGDLIFVPSGMNHLIIPKNSTAFIRLVYL